MQRFTKEQVEAMLADIESIYVKHGLTEDEKDTIWATIAAFCQYQVESGQGPFFDSVKHLMREPPPEAH